MSPAAPITSVRASRSASEGVAGTRPGNSAGRAGAVGMYRMAVGRSGWGGGGSFLGGGGRLATRACMFPLRGGTQQTQPPPLVAVCIARAGCDACRPIRQPVDLCMHLIFPGLTPSLPPSLPSSGSGGRSACVPSMRRRPDVCFSSERLVRVGAPTRPRRHAIAQCGAQVSPPRARMALLMVRRCAEKENKG